MRDIANMTAYSTSHRTACSTTIEIVLFLIASCGVVLYQLADIASLLY